MIFIGDQDFGIWTIFFNCLCNLAHLYQVFTCKRNQIQLLISYANIFHQVWNLFMLITNFLFLIHLTQPRWKFSWINKKIPFQRYLSLLCDLINFIHQSPNELVFWWLNIFPLSTFPYTYEIPFNFFSFKAKSLKVCTEELWWVWDKSYSLYEC